MDKANLKFRYVFRKGNILGCNIINIEDLELTPFSPEDFQRVISRDLFTGRKDDYGNELFENDVVEVSYAEGTGSCQETIKWYEHAGAFYVGSLPLCQLGNKIKKIGNIHFSIRKEGEVML